MMERHDHNNPWADKLQDIRLPGQEVAWEAMEAVLDREMPVNKWRDRRRWVLLIILLLLLIGVCNCPGRRLAGDRESAGWKGAGGVDSGTAGASRGSARERADTTDGTDRTSRTDTTDGTGGTFKTGRGGDTVNEKSVTGNVEGEADGGTKRDGHMVMHTVGKEGPNTTGRVVAGKRGRGSRGRHGMEGRRGSVDGRGSKGDTILVSGPGSVGGPGVVSDPGSGSAGGTGAVGGPGGKAATKDTVSGNGKTAAAKQVPKPKADPRRNDSTTTAARKPKADSILEMKGWLAGVGLNQFFTVGAQQKSNYNSSGTTGGISDYIPVPMVRYYFSRKLYVQLEAQFNAPQYTTKDLLASQSKPDSVTLPGRVLRTSLYIKKLFYFNLPLSVHYSPIPNLYIGGGIQYARLTNGVALYQDSSHNIFVGGSDSLRSSKIMSFRNDTAYSKLKTNEFRLLLDLNYNFKRFVIGARYNRALSDFINLQLSNTQATQSRNSSFQVYLRYIIWDGRKKTQNGPEVRRPEDRHNRALAKVATE